MLDYFATNNKFAIGVSYTMVPFTKTKNFNMTIFFRTYSEPAEQVIIQVGICDTLNTQLSCQQCNYREVWCSIR